MGEPTSEGRKSALKGRLVEGVRLIFIALLATGGFELGASFSEPSGPADPPVRLPRRRHRLRDRRRPRTSHASRGDRPGARAPSHTRSPARRRRRGDGRRADHRRAPDGAAPVPAGVGRVAHARLPVHGPGVPRVPGRSREVRGHLRPGRHEAAGRGRQPRRPARDRHQRVDRRPRRRPGRHRVRRRHDAAARRRPARAAVDLGLVGPAPPHARPPGPRRPGGAPEVPDDPTPARRGDGRDGRGRGARSPRARARGHPHHGRRQPREGRRGAPGARSRRSTRSPRSSGCRTRPATRSRSAW